MTGRVLVYGLAIAGISTVKALQRHGYDVLVADDDANEERQAIAAALDVELVDGRADDSDRAAEALLADTMMLCPAPGIPETHRIIDAALRLKIPIASEIELAYRWEQARTGGPRPMLAVTGTDGKTTTTKMAVAMLRAAGLRSIDAGNTDTPLVDAIEMDLDAFVVECSSFRLAWTSEFRADAAAWLNLQPDHLNWHRSMASYEAAKSQVFGNQRPADAAIGFADDPTVMAALEHAPGRRTTFGLRAADYRLDDEQLVGPRGVIADRSAMRRSLPHDVTNALAASALVIEAGLAGSADISCALADFVGPPHRLELLGSRRGASWFNDSKATTPHAAAAALRSFDRIILIAGGTDKGVDLAPLAAEPHRVKAVLAIGTTAPTIAGLFADTGHVEIAGTLDQAVQSADRLAESGDTVLLSPGCASFDQFTNFEDRGEVFRTLFDRLTTPDSESSDSESSDRDSRDPATSEGTIA